MMSCVPHKPVRFVIYAGQRSGSTWLRQMLNSHKRMKVYDELFLHRTNPHMQAALADPHSNKPHWIVHWSRHARGLRRLGRSREMWRYLDRIFTSAPAGAEAVGFKLMYDQSCLHPEVLAYLLAHRACVVHMVRENHLDVLLSQETRRVRDVAHAAQAVEQVQVHLEPRTLVGRLARRERSVRWAQWLIEALDLPHVRLSYEAMLANTSELNRVMALLNVNAMPDELHSPMTRLNTAPHWEIIANYEEVRRALAPTRFAPLLQTPT